MKIGLIDVDKQYARKKTSTKRYKDVEVGDIVDGVKITDVEKYGRQLTFTFDLIGGGWSFLVVYPCDYDKEAKFTFPNNTEEEENDQLDFFNELAEEA